MRRIGWRYIFFAGISLAFLSVAAYSDNGAPAETATEAGHQPVVAPVPSGISPADSVVAPVPSGISPADPGVSRASPSNDVSFPSPTPISTSTAPGGGK